MAIMRDVFTPTYWAVPALGIAGIIVHWAIHAFVNEKSWAMGSVTVIYFVAVLAFSLSTVFKDDLKDSKIDGKPRAGTALHCALTDRRAAQSVRALTLYLALFCWTSCSSVLCLSVSDGHVCPILRDSVLSDTFLLHLINHHPTINNATAHSSSGVHSRRYRNHRRWTCLHRQDAHACFACFDIPLWQLYWERQF